MDYYSSLDSRSLNGSTPTIFEIISAKELEDLLSPSLKYLIVNFVSKHPNAISLKFAIYFDELNLILRSLLELHFLKRYNSTFIEKFYGLKKISSTKIRLNNDSLVNNSLIYKISRLSKIQIYGILNHSFGGTYLKEKLNVIYEKLYLQKISKKINSKNDYWKMLFVKLYPYFQSSSQFLNILFQILYLSGRTKSTNFFEYLLKIEHSRLNKFDYELNEPKRNNHKTSNSTRVRPKSYEENLLKIIKDSIRPILQTISYLSSTIFPFSIFLLKFLEWWNSSEFASKFKQKSVSLDKEIPAPPKSTKLNASQPTQNSPNCPICSNPITNPAIIETGYVFCYPCIYNHLSQQDETKGGRCPITGIRLLNVRYQNESNSWKVDGIRRLMI